MIATAFCFSVATVSARPCHLHHMEYICKSPGRPTKGCILGPQAARMHGNIRRLPGVPLMHDALCVPVRLRSRARGLIWCPAAVFVDQTGNWKGLAGRATLQQSLAASDYPDFGPRRPPAPRRFFTRTLTGEVPTAGSRSSGEAIALIRLRVRSMASTSFRITERSTAPPRRLRPTLGTSPFSSPANSSESVTPRASATRMTVVRRKSFLPVSRCPKEGPVHLAVVRELLLRFEAALDPEVKNSLAEAL